MTKSSPLDKYFDAIESGRVDEVVEMFSEDALYVRPVGEPNLEAFQGRERIRDFLENRRGNLKVKHHVTHWVQSGGLCLIEGIVEQGGDPTVVFFSSAVIDPDGLISRYVTAARPADLTVMSAIGWDGPSVEGSVEAGAKQ